MLDIKPDRFSAITRPIVEVWSGLLRQGEKSKKKFNDFGQQCMAFYAETSGFMWNQDYMAKFLGPSIAPPKWQCTLNKGFEYVALMGPLLFWQTAARKCAPYTPLQLDPSVLSGGDPAMAEWLDSLAQQQATDDAKAKMRAAVIEHYLNYSQREQPGGGLAQHSETAIFEALVKGAGCLWTEPYQFPHSQRTLTGSFYQTVDDLVIDPDCRDPSFTNARWIARRHRNQFWEVEGQFGLPAGSLRDYANTTSNSAKWNVQNQQAASKKRPVSPDELEWWEVWSRAGVGNKLNGTKETIPLEFDDAVGDYAYLCICPSCPFPLNLPSGALRDLVAEEVQQLMSWPTPFWKDNKWPVSRLDFYPMSGDSCWPLPPLTPAIGELTILNILISVYVQQTHENSQQIIAYMEGAIQDLPKILNSTQSPIAVELKQRVNETVNEVLQFMKRPEVNKDIPQTIEFVLALFEQRTGMSPFLYGKNGGSNPRSAAEYQGKMDTVNIRPEYMAKKVGAWQSEVADKEKYAAWVHVRAADIGDQMGPLGAAAWDILVTGEAEEAVLRNTRCYVEASEMRRPNKAKQAADLGSLQQYMTPILAGYQAQTGDSAPLNGFIDAIGDAMEIDTTAFRFPEGQGPDPAQQAMQQAELAATAADAEKTQAETQKILAELETTRSESETLAMATEQKLQADAMIHQQKMSHAQQTQQLKTEEAARKIQLREQEARAKIGAALLQHAQTLQQGVESHGQQLAIANDKAAQMAQHSKLIVQQRLLMNAAQRKPTGGEE